MFSLFTLFQCKQLANSSISLFADLPTSTLHNFILPIGGICSKMGEQGEQAPKHLRSSLLPCSTFCSTACSTEEVVESVEVRDRVKHLGPAERGDDMGQVGRLGPPGRL